MADSTQGPAPARVVERLRRAVDDHDLEAVAECFSSDYVNETPAHPRRGFQGQEQIRRNWTQIFAGVPDISARILQSAAAGDTVWTEWEMAGHRVDAEQFLMRGVVIFTIQGETITSARFYLEPVEDLSGTADDHARRVAPTHVREPS